jgi:hypothetical protein
MTAAAQANEAQPELRLSREGPSAGCWVGCGPGAAALAVPELGCAVPLCTCGRPRHRTAAQCRPVTRPASRVPFRSPATRSSGRWPATPPRRPPPCRPLGAASALPARVRSHGPTAPHLSPSCLQAPMTVSRTQGRLCTAQPNAPSGASAGVQRSSVRAAHLAYDLHPRPTGGLTHRISGLGGPEYSSGGGGGAAVREQMNAALARMRIHHSVPKGRGSFTDRADPAVMDASREASITAAGPAASGEARLEGAARAEAEAGGGAAPSHPAPLMRRRLVPESLGRRRATPLLHVTSPHRRERRTHRPGQRAAC